MSYATLITAPIGGQKLSLTTSEQQEAIIARDRAERQENNPVVEHTLSSSGVSPTRKFTVRFFYADGSHKAFNGKSWS